MVMSLELPIKRACEEIRSNSDSGLEASKKAKAETQSGEYSCFRTFDEFCDHYGDSLEDPLTKWREIKLYLISEGQEDAGKKIQSFRDDLACRIESSFEFSNKYDIEEMTGDYYCCFSTYSADLAFHKLFKELQSSIKWDLSASELERIHDEASMKYNGVLSPFSVEIITGEIHFLKRAEQNAKAWVSFCTKFRHEVERKERDYMEVLLDMKEKDVTSFPFIKNGNNNRIVHTLKNFMKYINSATKGDCSEEELISEISDGPLVTIIPDTYADCIKEKMKIAAKLRLIE